MFEPDQDGVYARITASPGRRYFAVGTLTILGALLIYLPLDSPPPALALVVMLALGLASLWLAGRLWQATALSVELTVEGLRDSSGAVIARWDEMARIDRGAFAFKPSNGFLVNLKEPRSRMWLPGLWWRVGRRVGVGGVTPSGQCRFMAEYIALRLSEGDAARRR